MESRHVAARTYPYARAARIPKRLAPSVVTPNVEPPHGRHLRAPTLPPPSINASVAAPNTVLPLGVAHVRPHPCPVASVAAANASVQPTPARHVARRKFAILGARVWAVSEPMIEMSPLAYLSPKIANFDCFRALNPFLAFI